MKIIRNAKATEIGCLGKQIVDTNKEYRTISYSMRVECDDGLLLYNNLTDELVLLNSEEQAVLENQDITSPVFNTLIEKWFFVPKEHSDVKLCNQLNSFMRMVTEVATNNVPITEYTVFTTTDCNARCFYCYENHQKVYMDDSTKKAMVSLIENKAKNGKNISIVWYGGEPLMDFNSLEQLTRDIQKICNDNKVEYHAGMITNGYYFDDSSISKIDKFCIETVQITLDGIKEVHERRRPVIGDKNSFDTILNNVIRLNRETKTKVRVRINVDKNNIESAYDLVKLFGGKNLQNIDLTLGMLKEFGCNHNCTACSKSIFLNKEFSAEFLRFRKYVGDLGFINAYNKMRPEYKVNACTMDSPDAYVVDPYGEVYKCISQIGQFEKSIGNIKTEFDENFHRNVNAFASKKCRKCLYFPICKGGCLNKEQNSDIQECEVWKYITESLIEMDV